MGYKRCMANNLERFKKNADHETHILDSSVIKVHQHACGAIGKAPYKQAIGKSAGGWTTKVHIVTDSLGLPLHIFITVGQRHDVVLAKDLLLAAGPCENVIMDKAYHSDELRHFIASKGEKAVIPYKRNSLYPNDFDKDLYKERHLVECLFGRMKNYRRIATRYDKLFETYQAMLILCSILMWLRF